MARAVVAPDVIEDTCRWTKLGYESPYKREALGFLYGSIASPQEIIVTTAKLYRGGIRTRTTAECDLRAMQRRREELAKQLSLHVLGMFHSHVEIAGEPGHAISPDDACEFGTDEGARIEAVVSVWAVERPPRATSRRVLVGYDPSSRYAYHIRLYAKTKLGPRLMQVTRG